MAKPSVPQFTTDFQTALDAATWRAFQKYPGELDRITRARNLVIAGRVRLWDDGNAEVHSAKSKRVYKVIGTACECDDYATRNRPNGPTDGLCYHIFAACLTRKALALLPTQEAPAPESPGTTTGYYATYLAPGGGTLYGKASRSEIVDMVRFEEEGTGETFLAELSNVVMGGAIYS